MLLPPKDGEESQTLWSVGTITPLFMPWPWPKKVSLGRRVLRAYFTLWTLLNSESSTQYQYPSLPALLRPIQ